MFKLGGKYRKEGSKPMNQHTWIRMSYSKRRLKRTSQIGEGLRERTTTCSGESLLYEVRETQGDMGALHKLRESHGLD
jgi:hypothetical protein